MLRLGADVTHSVRDEEVDEEFLALMKKNKAYCCPTLVRGLHLHIRGNRVSDRPATHDGNRAEITQAQDPAFQRRCGPTGTANGKEHLPVAMRNLKKVYDSGVPS